MAQPTVCELESFFAGATIPQVVRINKAVIWSNVPEHVENYIDRLKTQTPGTFTTEPLMIRVLELKELLTEK